jgi:bifunctional DNase/RNase
MTVRALGALVALSALACSRESAPDEAPTTGHSASAAPRLEARAPAPAASPSAGPSAAPSPKPPPGYQPMLVAGVAEASEGDAVVLVDAERRVGVLVFVGGTEALSIALRLHKERFARPLTHDLLDGLLTELGARVESVRVDSLVDGVFHGTVLVRAGPRLIERDARASDAMALAIGNAAPIYVSTEVVRQVGVDLSKIEVRAPKDTEEKKPADERPGQVAL